MFIRCGSLVNLKRTKLFLLVIIRSKALVLNLLLLCLNRVPIFYYVFIIELKGKTKSIKNSKSIIIMPTKATIYVFRHEFSKTGLFWIKLGYFHIHFGQNSCWIVRWWWNIILTFSVSCFGCWPRWKFRICEYSEFGIGNSLNYVVSRSLSMKKILFWNNFRNYFPPFFITKINQAWWDY